MFNRFFRKLSLKLRRISLEKWGIGLLTVLGIVFFTLLISTFNAVIKQADVDKEVAQLNAAKSHRDHLYDELIDLISYEMFDDKELLKKYESYLFTTIRSACVISDERYDRFINLVKGVRDITNVTRYKIYAHLVDEETSYSVKRIENLEKELDEFRLETLAKLEPPCRYLVCNIVSLPTRYYRRFLSLLDELRELEKKLPESAKGE